MPHHIHVVLPDGLRVVADWREKVVPAMRRYHRARLDKKEPKPRDVQMIRDWHAANLVQSRLCYRHQCGHD